MNETWWQSCLAYLGFIGSILVLTAIGLVLAPPTEREISQNENVTIVSRVSK